MTTAEMFSAFLSNLTISNSETIGLRYGELTSALNRHFRATLRKRVFLPGNAGRVNPRQERDNVLLALIRETSPCVLRGKN